MKLKKLQLENFQGIRSYTLEPDGQNMAVYGDNQTGKTTIYNAFTWLLFDRPSTDEKNYSPKTAKGAEFESNLTHAVEGTLQDDIHGTVILRKEYKEVYTRKRSSATAEFTGHRTDYFVDGVPTIERDYKLKVATFTGKEEAAKQLTMPDYFARVMDWQDRRKLLVDMVGDVGDDEIYKTHPELKELLQYAEKEGSLEMRSPDEVRTIEAAKAAQINKELNVLPSRIDEATKALQRAISTRPLAEVERDLKEQEYLLDELFEKRADFKIDAAMEKQAQIEKLKSAMLDIKHSISDDFAKASLHVAEQNKAVDLEISQAKRAVESRESLARKAHMAQDKLLIGLQTLKRTRDNLMEDYNTIKACEWAGDEICPTCKQPIPPEDIEKSKTEFDKRKSEQLERIQAEVKEKASRESIKEIERRIKTSEQEIKTLTTEYEAAEKTLLDTLAKPRATPPELPKAEETESYKKLNERLQELQHEANVDTDTHVLDRMISEASTKISTLQKESILAAACAEAQERVTELQAKQKQLGIEYEKSHHAIYLAEQFSKAKADMLSDKINARFESVTFRLFTAQVNGGLKEECEVMIPDGKGNSIAYKSANNAAKINAGLEIIGELARFYRREMPVFVDNAESVTQLRKIKPQVIRLIVSEHDKELRSEREGNDGNQQ